MQSEEIQTPRFTLSGKGLVKINTDNRVDSRLKCNRKYVMYLPETDEVVHLLCRGIAIRAADLTILKHTKKGKPVTSDLNCIFGYQFETFDTVYFSSFSYREKCELYAIEDIYTIHESLDCEDVKVKIA
jgi:hypothetical protein